MAYVGRFATTRAKLAQYLRRKLREKGWEAPRPPDIEPLVERLARLGYVDDAAFALSKARSLGQRGYGERRVDHGAAPGGGRRGRRGARPRRWRATARRRRRSAMRSAAGWGRSRPNRPIASSATGRFRR